jgi:hypothetical protein
MGGNRIEGKGREWKGRGGRKRGGEGMDAPGAGPPQNFWARTATGREPNMDVEYYRGAAGSEMNSVALLKMTFKFSCSIQ